MRTAIIEKPVKCRNFLAESPWRAVKILQKGGLMARMSMSALLGAPICSQECHKVVSERDWTLPGLSNYLITAFAQLFYDFKKKLGYLV